MTPKFHLIVVVLILAVVELAISAAPPEDPSNLNSEFVPKLNENGRETKGLENGTFNEVKSSPEIEQGSPVLPKSGKEFGSETPGASSDATTSTQPTYVTTTEIYSPWIYPEKFDLKVILIITLSFLIPIGFMSLLFWRLQKEKKYLNAQNGALVFRETIIVPSYIFNNNSDSQTAGENADGNINANAAHMHAILYDTPPTYDTAVKSKETIPGKDKFGELPPPDYSSLHV